MKLLVFSDAIFVGTYYEDGVNNRLAYCIQNAYSIILYHRGSSVTAVKRKCVYFALHKEVALTNV